jgi:hypothetical protein
VLTHLKNDETSHPSGEAGPTGGCRDPGDVGRYWPWSAGGRRTLRRSSSDLDFEVAALLGPRLDTGGADEELKQTLSPRLL